MIYYIFIYIYAIYTSALSSAQAGQQRAKEPSPKKVLHKFSLLNQAPFFFYSFFFRECDPKTKKKYNQREGSSNKKKKKPKNKELKKKKKQPASRKTQKVEIN